MPDRLKERLDLDYHDFLDNLNAAYEGAYRDLMEEAPKLGTVRRVLLTEVHYPVGAAIRIQLGAVIDANGGRNDT